MKKIFFLIIPFFLFAFYPDFRPCYKKYSYIRNLIPVTKNRSVTFDKKKCLDYDPFTGMCVVKHKNKKYVKFFVSPKLGWWASSIKHGEIYVGNFAKDEVYFSPAELSVRTRKNSVITDMFCRALGIGDGEGFIKGGMVKHYVKYGYWGDVGIEVDENMKIVSFDPFYVKGIKTGEKIISINGKKAVPGIFSKYILQNTLGKKVNLLIGNKKYILKIRKKIYNYSPLEHYGIKINRKLEVTEIPEKIEKVYFIKPGAKIIKVNGREIKTFEELKKALSTYKNVTISLLQQGTTATIPLR